MPAIDDRLTEPGLSEYKREELKWSIPKNRGGYAPNGYEPYPAMRYRARLENGKIVCDDAVECQRIVSDEAEDRMAKGQGWCVGPTAAKEQLEREQEAIADAAAERAQDEKRMSPKAQAEATAYADSHASHVPEIPEARRRGRPRKDVGHDSEA